MCKLVEKQVTHTGLYEDNDILVALHPKPSVPGHTIIIPKKHAQIINEVEEPIIRKMFELSQKFSEALFESFNAAGTNVIAQNGTAAGQTHPHFIMHVIPRSEGDGLSFDWQPKQLPEDSMNKIHELMKIPDGAEAPAPTEAPAETIEEKEPEKIETDDKENYLLKQLERIP